ncbi:TraC family protein [Vibrio harveyi]|uniref:TraC family protein n=1 Tax=Vibrio harveyi TaxID=669 RepID=UPI003BB55366
MGLLNNLLLGNRVNVNDLERLSNRKAFSDHLPYFDYRATKEHDGSEYSCYEFLNNDATYGYIWECNPLTFVGTRQLNALHGLLKQQYPNDSVLQFILYPDHDLEPLLAQYASGKNIENPVTKKSLESTQNFFRAGSKGCANMFGIPLRNFRLFVALKSPVEITPNLLEGIKQSLITSGLSPQALSDDDLISFLFKFFNNKSHKDIKRDPTRRINKQIIKADTVIKFPPNKDYGKIGDKYLACLTPKVIPQNNNPKLTNMLFGGFMGSSDNQMQITTPFMFSLNVVFRSPKQLLKAKSATVNWQAGAKGISHKLAEIVKEYNSVGKSLATGGQYFYYVPCMCVFGDDHKQLNNGIADVEKIWGAQDYELQQETKLRAPMFLQSLPFGFYNIKNNLETMNRYFLADLEDIARLLPVQGDFKGTSSPVVSYIGRKGQMVGVNFFDKRANAHNFSIAGVTGGGKSFLINDMLNAYADSGCKVRVTDIGGSYKKTTLMRGGRYIDFDMTNSPCINPIDYVSLDVEDAAKNLDAATNVVSNMAYSFTGQAISELEASVLKEAIKYTHNEGNQEDGITAIRHFLLNYSRYGDMSDNMGLIDKARDLSYLLRDFGHDGVYGRLFNGKTTFDIKDESFACIELEKIRAVKELFGVVAMQIMNNITQDLYLGDRSVPSIVLFEEIASLLKKVGNTDMSALGDMMEEGYRRARKYRGAFGVVLQSMLDLKMFGDVGDVIKANAIFKYYLESSTFQEAVENKCITGMGDFGLEILESMRSARPHYSEFFIDTPIGRGVARLSVDSYRYLVNSSDGEDVAKFEELLKAGLEPFECIEQMHKRDSLFNGLLGQGYIIRDAAQRTFSTKFQEKVLA